MAGHDYRTSGKRAMNRQAPVINIQRFSIHDGPGIRSTVFLKGCHLRCAWCHNPETQKETLEILYTPHNCINCGACLDVCPEEAHFFDEDDNHIFDKQNCTLCMACVPLCPTNAVESAGKMMALQDISDTVLRDKAFYGAEGGMTLSGGEPLVHFDTCLALLHMAKENGIATAVQTSGYFDAEDERIRRLADAADVFLWDFKDGNNARHEQYTGKPNDKIIANLLRLDRYLDNTGKYIILRCIMVKTVNMDDTHFTAIANLYKSLKNCRRIELVPYHAMGGAKYKQLGFDDNGRAEWIPSGEDMASAEQILQDLGCLVVRM
jgi:pyruvate formate lyase activating enzyme